MFSLSTLYFKHLPRVMTSLLMSSPSISILHRLFRFRNWNSWDVTACSPSFFAPPLEPPEKDASAKLFLGSTRHHLVTHTNYLFIYFYFLTFNVTITIKITKILGENGGRPKRNHQAFVKWAFSTKLHTTQNPYRVISIDRSRQSNNTK